MIDVGEGAARDLQTDRIADDARELRAEVDEAAVWLM